MSETLSYYSSPGLLTGVGEHAASLAALPRDLRALCGVVQGLLVHRAWAAAYRVTPAQERLGEEGLHGAAAMLDRCKELDDAPLTQARAPDKRMLANCRHFSTLLTAFLRHHGTPARARCGFASYFTPGKHEDHWVCEYWRDDERRWALADAQLDPLQRAVLKIEWDPTDVAREQFWVAGQAWERCRAGEADPDTFGIGEWWGERMVSGNLSLDVASLNKVELLPWENFGIAAREAAKLNADELSLVERVAALSAAGDDASIEELRSLYETDERICVPDELMKKVLEFDGNGVGTGVNPLAG